MNVDTRRSNPPASGPRDRRMISRRGFSLAELIIAIFVLGIGVISIAALFPVGLTQQRRSSDAIMGPTVAKNAISTLRAKLSQDDFGWFGTANVPWDANDPTDFITFDPRYIIGSVVGDWGWRRPAFYTTAQPFQINDQLGFSRVISPGSIDMFRGAGGNGTSTEIPYNTVKYPVSGPNAGPPPAFIFTQEDRYFPQQSTDLLGGEAADPPQYLWDCMFRRWQGRIQVAVFVYRVQVSGGGSDAFKVRFGNQENPNLPPMPVYNLLDGSTGPADGPWTGTGPDGFPAGNPSDNNDNAQIPGTFPGDAFFPDQEYGWQMPRQWIMDQNGNVHRVLAGRRSLADGPVELTRAPEPVSYGRQVFLREPNDNGEIFELFYVPPAVVDPVSGREYRLTPVYATVKEL